MEQITKLLQVMTALLALVFPTAVFLAGSTLMATHTGRSEALAHSYPPNPKPLNTRFSYDVDDVDAFWSALGERGLMAEQRFLEFDLTFPTLYGGALAASVSWLSRRRRLWQRLLVLVPVPVAIVADWTENLAQLAQLHRYAVRAKAGLQPDAIRLASLATCTKLVSVYAASAILLTLAILLIVRASLESTGRIRRRSNMLRVEGG